MKSQTKPVKSKRLKPKRREVNRCGDDNRAQDKTDTILEAINKEYWNLKYADGSAAKYLFESHNKCLDRIKQRIKKK